MAWIADISRPEPYTDDVKVAGAPLTGRPAFEYGETTGRFDGAADETAYLPEDEVTYDGPRPVREFQAKGRGGFRATRRSTRWTKVLGAVVAVSVAGGGAIGAWALTSGPAPAVATKQPPAQAQEASPLTDAQRKAAEDERLRELKRRASRAARDESGRPRLFARGTPPATKTPTPTKKPTSPASGGPTPVGEAQRIARAMLPDYGWSPSSQFGCLVDLWNKESGWNTQATNPSSGAYGIPQALPGSKMASAGSDWQTSARTQIKWGLGYIQDRYGTPCAAWQHSESTGWY